MMLQQIQTKLGPIRLRQRADRALRWGTCGLIAGAILGSVGLLAQWLGAPIHSADAWKALSASLLLAVVSGLLWPTSWQSSARLVDATHGLKDRTLTALDFATRPTHEPLHSLQIRDAMQHLSSVDPRRVVPWSFPKLAPLAIVAIGVMLALLLLPLAQSTSVADAPAGPLNVVLDQATLLEETMLKDLEELAQEIDDPQLEELAEELKEALEKLQAPDVDQREALANSPQCRRRWPSR